MATDFGFEPTTDRTGYYFISYSTADSARVAEVCCCLHDKGLELWYDKGLKYGYGWDAFISKKIERCGKYIIFLTRGIITKAKAMFDAIDEMNLDEDNEQREIDKALKQIYIKVEYEKAERKKEPPLIVYMDYIDDEEVPVEISTWWDNFSGTTQKHGVDARSSKSPGQTAELILQALESDNHFHSDISHKPVAELSGDDGIAPTDNKPAVPSETIEKPVPATPVSAAAITKPSAPETRQNKEGVTAADKMSDKEYEDLLDRIINETNRSLAPKTGPAPSASDKPAQEPAKKPGLSASEIAGFEKDSDLKTAHRYMDPFNIGRDYKKAVEYYTIAAQKGNPIAFDRLGFCYEKGFGVKKDTALAFEYYCKAAELGYEEAKESVERLRTAATGESPDDVSPEKKEKLSELCRTINALEKKKNEEKNNSSGKKISSDEDSFYQMLSDLIGE